MAESRPPSGPEPVPAIALVDVVKEYATGRAAPAVRGVNLSIGEGEFFSLLGPSGCGKTTTLRMIAGFEEPTGGRIELYGENMVGVPANKRDVNMVFQSYALFPHLSVADNVAFGLRRRRVPKEEIRQRVGRMLETVELADKADRRPRQLSGGQQQRVALARALVNRPRALLLDEPLGALDLKLRQSMQLELKRIQREVGITFIYVTHDQAEALTMSDRIAVMNDGRVEQVGPPREVYERPASAFVAGFIGTSNVLRGRLTAVEAGTGVLDLGGGEVVTVAVPGGLRPGGEAEVTVRPEKITLTTAPQGSGSRLRGTVTEVVYLGTSTSYTVRTGSGAELTVFRPNDDRSALAPDRGDEVWLGWPTAHSYLLTGAAHPATDPLTPLT
ncbi:ABC transporter ATP-binding protein [Streptantibioticus cattleyicolor]|uniref:Spermidine/putrescine import ATP-binding protein PotA n=1 Tax=Streptantibioticus cattleyicolor (strain ATCC 35852 / DSM 46488 / JCM 4925 / NBRC 14057 / NRRL 8057) TaxID=1003195 RepID=F8JJ42_STREN|nr:ABC transporter ATP-binding protein [Streptantibioticus cattleyicolor]AEW98865.1 spermidine/putrescine ABC transporter ATPase subunit [Streptantibioticus cattleyicolor NRRL 8057 = DSM 46488]CCB72088.1 putative spermidine/putrescine transporter subunit; ATP-binding component of ABC superfamily tranporter [Streptantibioticus cattleyicolor NRRL 8057 = DSM 46488]